MQVVRVEFVTHYSDAQEAVDIVSPMLPDLRAFPRGSKIESWDVYSADEYGNVYSIDESGNVERL